MQGHFDNIAGLFKRAETEERNILYEHEIYSFLKGMGGITPPVALFLEKDIECSDTELMSIPGDMVILKIVSRMITHKTEAGGVEIVENKAEKIRDAIRQMMSDVPDKYARSLESGTVNDTGSYSGLSGEKLKRSVAHDIKGVLLVQNIKYDLKSFGSELIIGIKNTREFGMIITAGIGGTDTELFAETFRKGQAFVSASTAMTTGREFLDLFKNTVSYKKLAGLTRGQKAVSVDDQLRDYFSYFISLANYFSSSNPVASFVIDELEINPFVFSDTCLVPLDGLCRFRRHEKITEKRPWQKIDYLLHPESIGIIGVSTTRTNFGQIILNNIIANGYEKENIRIIKPGMDSFNGVRCISDLENSDIKFDLLVVAVGAGQVSPIVEKVTEKQICESVMLIPGGIGETNESIELAIEIEANIRRGRLREDGGPVFLGANCLGVVSQPGRYDTLFIPEEKHPKQRGMHSRNVAFISQSGAFMITRLSRMPDLDPAYMISVGNQTDLTLGDMVSYFKDRHDIDVIAVYAEGFKDLDGLNFIRSLREAVANGKDVIVYKAGKTSEGKSAAGSHTASIAGDYHVFESCVRQAGGIVALTFTQFEDLLMLAKGLNKKTIGGNRIAALSGAGFEAVGMADNIDTDEYNLTLARLSNKTIERLSSLLKEKGLKSLTEVKNPMDLNPSADDEAHILAVKYLAEDENVDAVVVGLDPLSPATGTLPEPDDEQYDFNRPGSMVMELPGLVDELGKPVIGVVDAGKLFDPMVDELKKKNMIIFRSADRAVRALAMYIELRLYRKRLSG